MAIVEKEYHTLKCPYRHPNLLTDNELKEAFGYDIVRDIDAGIMDCYPVLPIEACRECRMIGLEQAEESAGAKIYIFPVDRTRSA